MLLYCNRSFWRVVLQRHGSIFLRKDISVFSLVLATAAAGLQYLIDSDSVVAPDLPHHYGMHALGVVVAFAVVFRTNLGWQRYWESVTQLHFMYSKWADAYTQMYAFAQVTIEQTEAKGGAGSVEKVGRVKAILESLERNFGILSALSADRLAHGDLQRMEKRMEMATWREQISLRKDMRGHDITGATDLPEFMSRRKNSRSHVQQPLGQEWQMTYVVKEVPSEAETSALARSTDRVNMVMYWIVHGLAAISKDLDIAPPIQSRMYQELSNGMLGFSNCMKIADVPFPFPYAQLLTYILVVYAFFIPVYIVCFTKSMIAGPMLTFLLFQGIWGVNEVAKEIENPFGTDVNDISLADFHARFIDVLAEINMGSEAKLMMNEASSRQRNTENSWKSYSKQDQSERSIAVGGRLRRIGRYFTGRNLKLKKLRASAMSRPSSDFSQSGSTSIQTSASLGGVATALNVDVVPTASESSERANTQEQDSNPPIGEERTPLETLPSVAVRVRLNGSHLSSKCYAEVAETRAPDPHPTSPVSAAESKDSLSSMMDFLKPNSLVISTSETPLPEIPEVRIAETPTIIKKDAVQIRIDESGARPGSPPSESLMSVVDTHLAKIGASMERHLAQIAKELQTISGMQQQLHPHVQPHLRESL